MKIVELLRLLSSSDFKFDIDNNKRENCIIINIDEKEGKVYLEHDYWANVQYLIKGRIGCHLKISEIKGLEINTTTNICNFVYE